MLPSNILKEYNNLRRNSARHYLCHAPFTTINFEQNGNMRACCYNRADVLGKYPLNTIKQAWLGDVANQLRRDIMQNNLDNGCFTCKELMLAKNYTNTHSLVYDEHANAFGIKDKVKQLLGLPLAAYPKVFEFELSNKCNLECVMCNGYFSSAIRSNRENLPKLDNPYDDGFVEQLTEFIPYLTDAKFLGGEPFLIDIYYKIWEKIIEINPNIRVHITTNATILNARAKALLNKLNCSIVVSIDSLNKDNYESIRKNASYEKVIENINYLDAYRKEKGTYLTFAVCPMNNNWQYLPEMIEYANERAINVYFNNLWTPEELCIYNNNNKEEIIAFWKASKFKTDTHHAKQNIANFNNLVEALVNFVQSMPDIETIPAQQNQLNIPEGFEEKVSFFFREGNYKLELNDLMKSDPTRFYEAYNKTLVDICNPDTQNDVKQKLVSLNQLFAQMPLEQQSRYLLDGISYGIYKAIYFMENTPLDTIINQVKSSYI